MNRLDFNTAIITYPSDYDGELSIGTIIEYLEENKKLNNCKAVIAREDPDEDIQRIHFHMYVDYQRKKSLKSTKYYDIPLKSPVVCWIRKDKTRYYQLYSELASQLGIDNTTEMAPKLDQEMVTRNAKEGNNNDNLLVDWEYLTVAHPNIQLKKEWGDKYFMLKYVMKQKIVARSNFDVDTELEFLQEHCQEYLKKVEELTQQQLFKELNIESIDELIELCKKYCELLKKRKERKLKEGLKESKTIPKKMSKEEKQLCAYIREQLLNNPGIRKKDILNEILKNEKMANVYLSKYVNYSKVLNDLFKGKPSSKPKKQYEFKFWVPNELYDYLMWLDEWVMNWTTGKKELCEHRPKGLCLIGESRTGKTTLMSTLGDFSYFKNIWNIDDWETLPPFTIMDDMDAADEGKGLSFAWFKPFFGAQDCMTVTDKFKPKEDIVNGKPLIWINNNDITDSFKSENAIKYIKKNMIYINIRNRSLFEEPKGMDIYKYKEFDPKETWYYKNIYNPSSEITENNDNNNDDDDDELMPLSERKRKLSISEQSKEKFEKDKGRLLQELEEKIEKCQFLENEEEKLKHKLENELTQIQFEYDYSFKDYWKRDNTPKEMENYRQVLIDKNMEIINDINYSIVRIEKYQYLKKMFINCYYFIDKASY